MKNGRSLIIQFSKWPQQGRVKTRLAAAIGDDKALDVHIELASFIAHRVSGLSGVDYQLWLDQVGVPYRSSVSGGIFQSVSEELIPAYVQAEGDLGAKMSHAFMVSLSVYDRVLIVGSDCPGMDRDYLASALEKLSTHELVLGPAEDGGYVLIGLRQHQPELFLGMPWGESSVLELTLARASHLEIACACLSPQWDVDVYADYLRWQSWLRAQPG